MSRGGWTTHIVLVTVLFKPSASPIIVVTLVKQKKGGGGWNVFFALLEFVCLNIPASAFFRLVRSVC